MVVLRATAKVLRYLGPPGERPGASDTALGDWYVNRVVVGRQPLLLLTSAASLLSIVEPARDVRTLPSRLPQLVERRLRDMGIPALLRDAELAAMDSVVVGRTSDRSVLGSMNDFAYTLPYYLNGGDWRAEELPRIEAALAHTPCRSSSRKVETLWPDEYAPRLLWGRWGRDRRGTELAN